MARSAPSRRRTILDEGRARPFWNGQVVCACGAAIDGGGFLRALRSIAYRRVQKETVGPVWSGKYFLSAMKLP
jgi:hypothetical protein